MPEITDVAPVSVPHRIRDRVAGLAHAVRDMARQRRAMGTLFEAVAH